jgi:hypothetical protein
MSYEALGRGVYQPNLFHERKLGWLLTCVNAQKLLLKIAANDKWYLCL